MRSTMWTVGLLVLAAAPAARAQGARAGAGKPPGGAATANGAPTSAPAAEDANSQAISITPMPVPEELLQTHDGGLTAETVGRQACDTSFSAKQSLETMRSAEARVNQQWATFWPRLTGTARYTRLSNFTVGDINFAPPGSPPNLVPGTELYPLFLDQFLLQANLTVPISDYFLKLNQNVEAANKTAEAAKYDLGAARATAYTNGKAAYYAWLQARGQVIVAVQTLNDQRAHLNDTRNQFAVGNSNKADTLRAETAVSNAELQLEITKNAADLAEAQMRVAIHATTADKLLPAEGLDVTPPTFQGNLQGLVQEGLTARYEVKSALANAESARRTAASQKGNQYPVVSAFGDAVEANPNSRLFPAQQKWFPTWDAGIQAIWSPNDTLIGHSAVKDYEARANALEAQAQVTREGIEIEVTQAYEQVRQWDIGILQTRRELISAEEAARVARELFNNGRGTALTLADAETDLTRARLDALNATVNARVARVRLDHAVGRDLRAAVSSQ